MVRLQPGHQPVPDVTDNHHGRERRSCWDGATVNRDLEESWKQGIALSRAKGDLPTVAAGLRRTVLSTHDLPVRKLPAYATTADMQTRYLHQHSDWPALTWDDRALTAQLGRVERLQGNLLDRMRSLGTDLQQQATLDALTGDVVKTSAIEGEFLDPARVRASIAWHLGIGDEGVPSGEDRIEGMVYVTLDSSQRSHLALTEERLLGWHAALFSTGRSGRRPITVGNWRTHPIQVVSGAIGQEKVHFEGPAPSLVPGEMAHFLEWLNRPSETSEVLRAALAHLWFVTVHPFDDGNGRIARAISDTLLTRADGNPRRIYSMSAQIHAERARYYRRLEQTQRTGTDITPSMSWFLGCLERSLQSAEVSLDVILAKARFWQRIAGVPINERQAKMLTLLLDNFKGNLTTAKWARIAKCSRDTAQKDINDLICHGILARSSEAARSTAYRLTAE